METLRQDKQFKLNYCPLQKMYNIENTILTRYTKDEGVSFWFDKETADHIRGMSSREFVNTCKQRAGNNLNSVKVLRGVWDEFTKLQFDDQNKLVEEYKNPLIGAFYKGENKNLIRQEIEQTFRVKDAILGFR
jgi:hypothetical protein